MTSISRRGFAALAATAAASAFAAQLPSRAFAGITGGQIVILGSNDVHCAIEADAAKGKLGYAGVATLYKQAQSEYGAECVGLVDSGDFSQGLVSGTLTKGEGPLSLMDYVGYQFSAVGNHEFDYGYENLKKLRDMAGFQMLACNISELASGNAVFAPYAIKEYGPSGSSHKIGFVGVTTPHTATESNPLVLKDADGKLIYDFKQGNNGAELYKSVQDAVDAARNDGAEYVILLAHLGQGGDAGVYSSAQLAANTKGIDVILDGHSHETYIQTLQNSLSQDVIVAQTGTQLAAVNKLVIDVATGQISVSQISAPVNPDPDTVAQVEDLIEQLKVYTDKEIGRCDYRQVAYQDDGKTWRVRNEETNAGDLMADTYRSGMDAQIGFANAGSVRSDIPAGVITYGSALSVVPFSNILCKIRAKGQTIADALEWGCRSYPIAVGAFPQVSGMSFVLDKSIQSPVKLDPNGNYAGIEGKRRVRDIKVAGEPIDLDAYYTIGGTDFMLSNGGDGYSMFVGSELLVGNGPTDVQALVDYIRGPLEGVIGEAYADKGGQGRIRIMDGSIPVTGDFAGSGLAASATIFATGTLAAVLLGLARRNEGEAL